MDKAQWQAEVDKLPPDFKKIVDALDGNRPTMRISIALILFVIGHMENRKLSHEQFYDVFIAGMDAHRIASTQSFFDECFFSDDGLKCLEAAGGISTKALAGIALLQHEKSKQAVEKFILLTTMGE